MRPEAALRLDELDYDLPRDRVAQRPSERRDDARLLAHDVGRDATRHARVGDLPELLEPTDLLVVNDTRVLPARLYARRRTGGLVELLVLDASAGADGTFRAFVSPARRLDEGERVELLDDRGEPAGERGGLVLVAREREPDGTPARAWRLRAGVRIEELVERFGRMPLPPYVERPRGAPDPDLALDRERYQTIFAREPGAIAAPTAGLHFTPELERRVRARGVEVARVTLHVGAATFRPIETETVEEHRMHAERFEVPPEAAEAVRRCRARGGRVVCVGTTTVRALESRAGPDRTVRAGAGETRLFLHPGAPPRVVDALLTNFHLPRSSLLVLVSALAGRERVLRLYGEAIEAGYRFYSYGDAMLLYGLSPEPGPPASSARI